MTIAYSNRSFILKLWPTSSIEIIGTDDGDKTVDGYQIPSITSFETGHVGFSFNLLICVHVRLIHDPSLLILNI